MIVALFPELELLIPLAQRVAGPPASSSLNSSSKVQHCPRVGSAYQHMSDRLPQNNKAMAQS